MTADQSRPVSRVSVVEALTQIRALCDKALRAWPQEGLGTYWVRVDDIRAVLDAVSVDATPPQGIDRDALVRELDLIPGLGDGPFREGIIERILALVRPVEGVVLSREERRVLLKVTGRMTSAQFGTAVLTPEESDTFGDLLERLEGAS